jgi:hypothetical protein
MDTDRRIALASAAAALAGAALVLAPKGALAYDHHGRMRNAIEVLRGAREEVASAGNDWGGHRDRALGAIDHAIAELHEALAWADAHGV